MSDNTNAERQRRWWERQKAKKNAADAAEPIHYERPDWRLFIDKRTLPQKAGGALSQIGRVVLKELVDNALDAGAGDVTLTGDAKSCIVSDDGPGIDPDQVPRLFAVNRPLISSKLKRTPTRGMLGNGLRVVMGAVAAFDGTISVTTRGRRYDLGVDTVTGETKVLAAADVPAMPGVQVEIAFPQPIFTDRDYSFARQAIQIANIGEVYSGPSMPSWHGKTGLKTVIAAAPKDVTSDEVMTDLFGTTTPVDKPVNIGALGEDAFGGYYHRVSGTATIEGATVPFTVEAWIYCERVENGDNTFFIFYPLINRSPSLATIRYHAASGGLRLYGCELDFKVAGAKRAKYFIDLSLIAPYVTNTTDGKAPDLSDFKDAINKAVCKAANEAYRNMIRPPTAMSIKDAAYAVMKSAYLKASDNGKLPAKARQIMYAARGDIIRLTDKAKFDDKYFTQTLLPDYLADHPDETADWDVVYDARGNFIEPHTQRRVALGTVQVRQYLGDRPAFGPATRIEADTLYPTSGPKNRYRNILFIEKEGFDELFAAVQLAERYDIAIMSTKGMSVVAARQLLDRLAGDIDNVFVLHDLDVSGFSIAGTLGTDSRRYTFDNEVPIIDIGLRLEDIDAMDLEAEEVKVEHTAARRYTLAQHGATEEEIEFLTEPDDDGVCHRVELNAMTSRQLVDFIEAKLVEHGVEKVVPANGALAQHARRMIEQELTRKALEAAAAEILQRAADVELPEDLEDRIQELIAEQPAMSWDLALAQIVTAL
jgi:hypothetical protein